jgi:DNA-binding LacI/PurR family transcriptional regulator
MMLAGCIRAASEKGLLIPDEVAIAGFEGFRDTGFDYLVSVPITVNEHPTHEMAVSAVDLLIEQIQGLRSGDPVTSRRVVLKTKMAVSDPMTRKTQRRVEAEKVN